MATGNSIPVYRILENLYRTSGYTQNFNLNDVVELVGEAIDLIGVPIAYIEKITDGNPDYNHPQPIEIKNYKGKLPKDLHQIIQTRTYDTKIPIRYTTDSFHIAYHCPNSPDLNCRNTDLSYKIHKGGIIHTSFKEGKVEMAYNACYIDKHGLPLIPAEERFIKGIESYVKYKLYLPLWEVGTIPDKVFAKTDQEYLFYMGSAENEAHLMSLDQGISIKNIIVNMIPDINTPENFFRNSGEQEQMYNN